MGNRLTMGNFFSGSGTWELAAKICGIDVLFESEVEPFPVALEAKRFPEAIQLGDVSKVNGAEIPPVDIMTNSSPCFIGSSLVNTSDGLKEIKDVKIGDKVLTHNNEYKTVTDSGCTGVKKVFELRAMGIDSIICTENHPLLVRKMTRKYPTYYVDGKRKRGNTRVFGEPEWKPLKDLDKTYYIGTSINQNSENSKNLTVEEMWLLGRYIADGYRRHDQPTVAFCIGYAKVDEFMKHLGAYRGYIDRQRTAMKYCITDKRLWELCGMCGDRAINKEFPAWILDLPAGDLKVVIDGYLSGDGCYNEKRRLFQSATISRKLAYSLSHAVAKAFCCTYKIYKIKKNPTCVIEGRTVNQHDTYEVRFKEGRKQDKAFYEDGHVWFPIRDIAEHGESEVYNLSVEDDESYTVQNIMVHNCQDLSVAGKRAGLDGERSGLFMEVIRITKEMRNADRLRSGRTTEYLRPRFWCWENVPGALSSAGGADFRTVIEEVIGIVEPERNVPMPKKWSKSGIVDGDNWQLAWRIMDAQFYGVAQRRRRLYLVLDTFGHRAGEILFERESVSWNFAEIAQAWKRTSLSFEERIDIASRIVNGELRTDSRTLEVAESGIDSGDDTEVFGMNEPVCFDGSNVTNPINASNPKPGDPCHTLSQDSRNYVVEKN